MALEFHGFLGRSGSQLSILEFCCMSPAESPMIRGQVENPTSLAPERFSDITMSVFAGGFSFVFFVSIVVQRRCSGSSNANCSTAHVSELEPMLVILPLK